MNNHESITVIIDETGVSHIEAHHVKGRGCHKLTAFITDVLGKVCRVKRKPEYYVTRNTAIHEQVKSHEQ